MDEAHFALTILEFYPHSARMQPRMASQLSLTGTEPEEIQQKGTDNVFLMNMLSFQMSRVDKEKGENMTSNIKIKQAAFGQLWTRPYRI